MIVTLYGTTLPSIIFNNGVPDANGSLWWVDEIDGWDSPDQRLAMTDHSGSHGQSIGLSLYGARPIILRGTCETTSPANHQASRELLARRTDRLTSTSLLQVAEVVPKGLDVIRAGRVRMLSHAAAWFDFEVPLLAPDPRKYGSSSYSTAIGAVITPAGNFETPPSFVIAGATTNPIQVVNATLGQTLQFNIALTGGQTLNVNTTTRSVTVNGVNRRDIVDPASVWWVLAPAANTINYFGGGSPLIQFRDAWI